MAREKARVKKKERKNISTGVCHVNASFNNTKILIADAQGNAIAWSSAGTMGFKGSRKSTPYAAQMAAEDAGKKAQEHGVRTLEVEVQGPGSGRESALRALAPWASRSPRSGMSPRSPTTAAGHRNGGASDPAGISPAPAPAGVGHFSLPRASTASGIGSRTGMEGQ